MAERLRVRLVGEDRGHENVGRALIDRVARAYDFAVDLVPSDARGGIGVVTATLKQIVRRVRPGEPLPDLLVVLLDADEHGRPSREALLPPELLNLFPHVVLGCPDPCVERWVFSDPAAIAETLRVPREIAQPTQRDWKQAFRSIVAASPRPIIAGASQALGIVAEKMSLDTSGMTDASLSRFLEDLRRAMQRISDRR